MTASKIFFVKIDGHEYGPFEPSQLKTMAKEQKLKRDNYVRKDKSHKWYLASDVVGLFESELTTKINTTVVQKPKTAKQIDEEGFHEELSQWKAFFYEHSLRFKDFFLKASGIAKYIFVAICYFVSYLITHIVLTVCDVARAINRACADRSNEWRDDPPTERQINYANHLGIDYPEFITKGELSDLIDQAKKANQRKSRDLV